MERQQTDEVPLETLHDSHHLSISQESTSASGTIFVDAATQTENVFFLTSTPTKSFHNHDKSHTYTDLSEELETMESNSSIDPDYDPVNITTSSQEDATDIISEKKFVVFESMIDELFNLIRCPTCNLPVEKRKKSVLGTSLHCKLLCTQKHLICDWKSQPLLGRLPAFNLLMSAAIFFSGIFSVFVNNEFNLYFCTTTALSYYTNLLFVPSFLCILCLLNCKNEILYINGNTTSFPGRFELPVF